MSGVKYFRPVSSAAIIIAFRDRGVDPLRQRNLDHVAEYWKGSGLPVHVVDDGREGDAHFCRSAAYNRGAAATDADVLCYIESDIILPYAQLHAAIDDAQHHVGLVVPLTVQRKLSEADSELVRAGADPVGFTPEVINETGKTGLNHGCAGVISRRTLAAVGQFDEVMEGHGHDDTAMLIAFDRTCGPVRFVDGVAYHLYHLDFDPTLTKGDHITAADAAAQNRNLQRLQLYRSASSATVIRQLTSGWTPNDWRARFQENSPTAGRYAP